MNKLAKIKSKISGPVDPQKKVFQSNTKYAKSLCFDWLYITWRKSSQSHWNAREIISSLIMENILEIQILKSSRRFIIFCKTANVGSWNWPILAQLTELNWVTLYTSCPLPGRKPCPLFLAAHHHHCNGIFHHIFKLSQFHWMFLWQRPGY